MKIKFTVTLSASTVKAFEAEGYSTGEEIKDHLVLRLEEAIEEVRQSDGTEEEEDDDA